MIFGAVSLPYVAHEIGSRYASEYESLYPKAFKYIDEEDSRIKTIFQILQICWPRYRRMR